MSLGVVRHRAFRRLWAPKPSPGLLHTHMSCPLLPLPGKYIENHGVVHNMFYNTTTKVRWPYHTTLGITSWWDTGSIPIWITAQRQVRLPAHGETEATAMGSPQQAQASCLLA